MALLASEAHFLFEISGIKLGVEEFTAREEISSPCEVNLSLVSEDEINFDDVIGKEALLTILGDEADRYFHGIVNKFIQTGSRERFNLYQARMVPSLWMLSLEQDCRIFQKKSVTDIVKQVLQDAGITSDRFDFRLQGQYDPKEYCVQYRETDLNFISRLLEEEGIFYFFEHAKDKHLLVFGDSPVNYQPISGEPMVVYNPGHGMVPEKEAVIKLILSRQIRSGKFTYKDFNFEKPSLDLTVDKLADENKNLEIYDYPGEYLDEDRGKKLAQIRLQEAVMFKDKAEGQSGCPRFIPGFTFTLTKHDCKDFNQEYLLVGVTHTGSQPQVLEEQADMGAFRYENQFLGIPSSVTFRPERDSPKPVMEGVQTAIVTGPDKEEIYTDEYGRIKVQFHWDREGKNDEKSSCWIRVSQAWAGAGWGAMHIPRVGHEVIVDFLESDPDRPIITGRVYNGSNTPPYELPAEKTKSTIKSMSVPDSGGVNEIRFEDKTGEEQLFIQAEKTLDIRAKDKSREFVGESRHLIITENQMEKVDGDKHLTVGGDHNEKIAGTISIQSESGDILEKAGGNYALDAYGDIHIKGGSRVVIEAGMQVSLKASGSFIDIGPSGVSISGAMVMINSGGSAGSGSGCSPASPDEPEEADTTDPGRTSELPGLTPSEVEATELTPQALTFQQAAQSGTPFCET
ncbi:MAG: type VI secretion system tip protein VgrG [Deltaproteobacteria bacterium]|nr:type VI secretion system tip protein VgrG [Deltaproteobacteria bacterium]MBW2638722.1 type VI secretion system tip protein VgrG [Deltaproteobacteria bacterium]MBW2679234.1 type VI secretion system tip protein VgrG [Deltaproteobacteria bacterium]